MYKQAVDSKELTQRIGNNLHVSRTRRRFKSVTLQARGFKNCFGFDCFMSRRMVQFFWICSVFFFLRVRKLVKRIVIKIVTISKTEKIIDVEQQMQTNVIISNINWKDTTFFIALIYYSGWNLTSKSLTPNICFSIGKHFDTFVLRQR